TREYFFSTSFFQQRDSRVPLSGDWVASSLSIPSTERPRHVEPCLKIPDGLITTKRQYLMVFHDGDKEIPNPDPKFQDSWLE
ncbi:MAG: hypothetical protein HYT62_03425, partial [Candidatus Yanofskybacteria bacterium]|nr:hypothetical protein [Candidatus Yanofskybacteria bacterium]